MYISTKSFSDATMLQCIRDYEQYEKDGFIGDCTLREVAEATFTDLHRDKIILWMQQVAFEAYRRFANYYISSNSNQYCLPLKKIESDY